MASKHPRQYESPFVACFLRRGVAEGKITSLEVASIAFVWSAATPLPRLPHDFRAEARTHFIYDLEETT